MSFHPDSLPDLDGKVFIVTGGNSGMFKSLMFPHHRGYYTVSHLAEHGAHVYMCSRSLEKGTEAIASIKKTYPSANIDLLQMDLMNLTSVVAAAKHFLTLETTLHGLVFTEHLLPVMLKTSRTLPPGSVRIVNLTSSGHLGAPKTGINFDNLNLKDEGPWQRYGQSKVANILHAKTLHKIYGPGSENDEGEIWTSSVHPGLVETNLSTSVEPSEKGVLSILSALRVFKMFWSADKGSWNSLFCAASQDMKAEQSGMYTDIYHRCGEPWWESSAARDEKLAERLDKWTRDVMSTEGWIE
ncbi:uncharacterized protein CLUP02_12709 [Colletotrichum lupini]|uniref:Uncharacterized protein n=1 Tax=Colletotrichum lupini TaxID=145971 RepID=A0A9Q8T121_9PEZI|nr:uncharacterized protein CLUP02_12709 [Colletotrichum lupini]UQC87207.1 hypothetical protein CLUP02_12709 [Colletotrichum lupini]